MDKAVIVVGGQFENGKDLVSDAVCGWLNDHAPINVPSQPWRRNAFAEPIKEIFCKVFGKTREWVEEWKRKPECPPGFLRTVRQCLIDIGDGYRQMKPDIWIEYALRQPGCQVISDARYENEFKAVKECGGYTILIYRPGFRNNNPNASEQSMTPYIELFLRQGIDGETGGHPLVDYFFINDAPTFEEATKKVVDQVIPSVTKRFP